MWQILFFIYESEKSTIDAFETFQSPRQKKTEMPNYQLAILQKRSNYASGQKKTIWFVYKPIESSTLFTWSRPIWIVLIHKSQVSSEKNQSWAHSL